jgi:hypothetical protein
VGVHRGVRRVSLREASSLLDISKDAVRQRIRRGTIESEKGEDGRVYVFVGPDQVRAPRQAAQQHPDHAGHAYPQHEDRQHTAPLVEELRDRVRFLERELERKDAILLNMTEAMKALNPPATQEPTEKPREAPTGPTEQPGRVEPQTSLEGAQEPRESPHEMHMPEAGGGPLPHDQQTPSERPWWRRVFGG